MIMAIIVMTVAMSVCMALIEVTGMLTLAMAMSVVIAANTMAVTVAHFAEHKEQQEVHHHADAGDNKHTWSQDTGGGDETSQSDIVK